MPDYPDAFLRDILRETKTIAVLGASANPERPSHNVSAYLIRKGYRLFPVNPAYAGRKILGREVYATLSDVPEPIDMVDVFRRSSAVSRSADAILALDPLPRTVWMQLGVRDDEAAARLEERGIRVVMDRCPKIEIPRLS